MEPEPGDIDWAVAVTRAAFLFGMEPSEGVYNSWGHEYVDFSNEGEATPASDEHLEAGLERLCNQLEDADGTAFGDLYLGVVAQEAVHGAVLASASEEFHTANSVLLVQASRYSRDDPSQEVVDASEAMAADLRDEWVELYELQTELEQEVFTLEGAQSAQSAVAERCDVTIDDADVVAEPARRFNPSLVYAPPPAALDADE